MFSAHRSCNPSGARCRLIRQKRLSSGLPCVMPFLRYWPPPHAVSVAALVSAADLRPHDFRDMSLGLFKAHVLGSTSIHDRTVQGLLALIGRER